MTLIIAAIPTSRQPVTVATSDSPQPPSPYERVDFDDGSVRVRGAVPPDELEALELTHSPTGRDIDGFDIWWPKEADDDPA